MNKKIIILLTAVFFLTGCGAKDKYIMTEKNEPLKYEVTGHMVEKNILCKPEKTSEIYKLYKENEKQLDTKLEEIPYCSTFTLNKNQKDSIWNEYFLKPITWLILKLGYIVNNLGLGLILVGILIRVVLFPVQFKSTKQSLNIKKATPELQKLEKKYKDKNDNESMMAKSQEMMLIYKKYKVNPMMGCLLAIIQIPLFIAFLQAIYKIPVIYEETLFNINLGMTPSKGIANGNYIYLILIILILLSTYYSFKYSMSQTPQAGPDMEKQTKTMLYVMMIVITFASFSFPAALALYWITTNAFVAIQTFLTSYFLEDKGDKPNKSNKISKKLKVKEGLKYGKNNK